MTHSQPHNSKTECDKYEYLLMRYASGCLDQAQTMIVTAHLGLSDKGHDLLKKFSSMGGTMLKDKCAPSKMSEGCLDNILAKIDNDEIKPEKVIADSLDLPDDHCLTKCIQSNLKPGKSKKIKWQSFYPGICFIDLPLECTKSKAQLIKAAPGKKAPAHTHGGLEITLLLDGAMIEHGETYNVGDLIVHDETAEAHSPMACPENGCVCLAVSTAPMKFTGFARILNPFIRTKF